MGGISQSLVLLFIARFWVYSCYETVISIEFARFLSLRVLRGGHKGGGRYKVSVIPYPLFFFESMYSHVYGVKWSPWSVNFEINYLREGVRVLKYPLSLNVEVLTVYQVKLISAETTVIHHYIADNFDTD